MCNSNKNKIIQMYYTEHLRPTDISEALNIDNGYIYAVTWDDFLKYPRVDIDLAISHKEKTPKYKIKKML